MTRGRSNAMARYAWTVGAVAGLFGILVVSGCSSLGENGPTPEQEAAWPKVQHVEGEQDHDYPPSAPGYMRSLSSPIDAGDIGSVAQGEALFKENCSRCHGLKADGSGVDGRTLNPPPANLTEPHFGMMPDHLIYYIITTGIEDTAMPDWRSLPSKDRWRIINYLRTLSPAMGPGGGGHGGMQM